MKEKVNKTEIWRLIIMSDIKTCQRTTLKQSLYRWSVLLNLKERIILILVNLFQSIENDLKFPNLFKTLILKSDKDRPRK